MNASPNPHPAAVTIWPGVAVLLVEQHLDFCRELADEVNIMERGQIVHTGPAEDLDKPEIRKLLTV